MRLIEFKIKNFRGYKDEVSIKIDDLTVVVGRNDIGKSTILEAMDIFFNDKNAFHQLEFADINKEAMAAGDKETVLTAVFDQLPDEIIIDDSVTTKLSDEYLLDDQNHLVVIKRYSSAGKAKVTIWANHPSNPNCNNLLLQKIGDLKVKASGLTCEDWTKKNLIRKAIWTHYHDDLQLKLSEIDTTGDGMKDLWAKLENYIPIYSLFQSDRSNNDKDKEAQDPMKEAVKEIIGDPHILSTLETVAKDVLNKIKEVTDATLNKLSDMNPQIANSLSPSLPSVESLKWADVFKNISITGDDDIAINKRGSGVKRLILLNFFRAKAERIMKETNHTSIIYAIEEPETSQHISHQRILIQAFKDIALQPNAQILLTTHSSHIVKMMSFDNLRLIESDGSSKVIKNVKPSCLPFPSLNEINFSSFGELSIDYHNELYGHLQYKAIEENVVNCKEDDFDTWLVNHGCQKTKTWKKEKNNGNLSEKLFTTQTYIRNYIHHPENKHNDNYKECELKTSIEEMRNIIVQYNLI